MAISGLAPAEKSEHLIYAIFPVSLSLWLATIMTTNVIEVLTVIGVLSSVLTIALFEIKIDDYIVKKRYSRKWMDSESTVEKSLLIWEFLFKTWYKTNVDPPQYWGVKDDLMQRVGWLTEKVVSSYAIRRRLWTIRGSFYLAFAIPFVIHTGILNLGRFAYSNGFPLPDILASTNPTAQLQVTVVISTIFIIGQLLLVMKRHSHLRDYIYNLTILRYVQKLLAYDSIENPSKYLEDTEHTNQQLINLRREVELLDEIINMDDWATFIDRWVPVRSFTELSSRHRFQDSLDFDKSSFLLDIWKEHQVACQCDMKNKLRETRDVKISARKLAWTVHYANEFVERSKKTGDMKEGGCTDLILSIATDAYYADCNGEGLRPSGWHPSGFPKAILRSTKGTEGRLDGRRRELPRLTNPAFIFHLANKDDRFENLCRIAKPKFLQFMLDRIDSFFSSKVGPVANANGFPEHENLKKQLGNYETLTMNQIAQLIIDSALFCHNQGQRTNLWYTLNKDEQLDILNSILERVKDSKSVASLLEIFREEKRDEMDKKEVQRVIGVLQHDSKWKPYLTEE